MLPILRENAQKHDITPNLTIVTSELQFVTPVSPLVPEIPIKTSTDMCSQFPERGSPSIFDALNDKEQSIMSQRYPTSKLLEVFACREIAESHSLDKTKVVINFVNPGWCHSELMREKNSFLLRMIMRVMCRTTEVGSRTLVQAGVAGPETHGQFLSDCKISQNAPLVEGPEGAETQRRVWYELAARLEDIKPGITKVLNA